MYEDEIRFAVKLQYGKSDLNIGEIATGAVKSTIDCLFTAWGGALGTPCDWKIHKLFVEKGSFGTSESEILISISEI